MERYGAEWLAAVGTERYGAEWLAAVRTEHYGAEWLAALMIVGLPPIISSWSSWIMRKEAAMRTDAEANLLALIDSTEDMWGSVDLDYRMVVFNQNFVLYIQSCFGVTVTEGMNPAELLPPERAAAWLMFYQRALTNGTIHTEHTLHDGRVFEISVRAILADGHAAGISVYGRDITARKQVEMQLRDSEERFRSTFEQAAIGIVHTSFEGRWQRCNRKFTQITGYTQEEIEGVDFLQITHPDDRAENARAMQELASGRVETIRFEKRYRHKNAQWIWVNLTISTQRDGQGTPLHFISFVEDITHRKESEKALESMTQALQASENRYRMAFLTCLDCFSILTVDEGVYIDINQAFTETFGFERNEAIGHSARELNIWVDLEERERMLALLRRDSACENFEARFRKKNGQTFFGRNSNSTIELDGKLCYLSVIRDVSESKAAEECMIAASEALRLTEERYRVAFETSLDPICIIRLGDSTFVDVNSAFLDCLLYQREEVISRSTEELGIWVDQSDRQKLRERLHLEAKCKGMEMQFRKRSGELFWGQLSAALIEINGVSCVLAITRDVTADKAAEEHMAAATEAIRLSEERYHTVFQTSLDGISISRLSDGCYIDVNNSFLSLLGYQRNEIIGRTSFEVGFWADAADRARLIEEIHKNGSFRDFSVRLNKKNGEILWSLTSSSMIEIEGVTCLLSLVRDVSEAKAAREKIEDLANFDPLTRLPNRQQLLDRLQTALKNSARNGRKCALLLVDIDSVKTLNEAMGHHVGDLLLQEVARRLTSGVREADLVARFGGDEFIIMLEELNESAQQAAEQAQIVGEKLIALLAQPYQLGGHEYLSSSCMGITILGEGREDASEALQQVDIAMDQAKSAGKNSLHFFTPDLRAAISARTTLEEELRRAIREKQFILYYQPQVNRGQIVGSEALVRWRHPQRGILAPGGFISLAEETGLILELGSWVLEEACEQIALWAKKPEKAHLTVAVNISALQFRQPEFEQQVLAALRRSGANPVNLKLELTESMLVENIEEVIQKMTCLRSQGITFSLDDFGTGYSSLTYLKRLPLNQLKIDRSFVRDILTDASSGAIAETIISLGKAMGLPVIAEGVETEEQRAYLARLGCHAFQGYLTSRPLPLEEFESLLDTLNSIPVHYEE
jgi:diguanylate cyclase (GGDEF)-like protein/PAS domain S-box-containing protein